MRLYKYSIYLILCVILISACQNAVVGEAPPKATMETFSQWVMTASASSEYGYPDWGSMRVTGPPDVNACADDPRAWASGRGNGAEWLLLEYRVAVFATQVNIYQTYGRGAISLMRGITVRLSGKVKTMKCPVLVCFRYLSRKSYIAFRRFVLTWMNPGLDIGIK